MMPEQRRLYQAGLFRAAPGDDRLLAGRRHDHMTFSARAAYDTLYEHYRFLMTDVMVLAPTVRVVLRGTGY